MDEPGAEGDEAGFAAVMGVMGVMIATGELVRTREWRNADGSRCITYTVVRRDQPNHPPGSGSGKTRRRNARRARQKQRKKAMATTIMMDDFAFQRLPDRQRLTGAPLAGQDYRDGTREGVVCRWVEDREHGGMTWVYLARMRPAP